MSTLAKPIIYIAGPITLGNRDDNIRRANVAMVELMKLGYVPINPLLSCFVGWPEVKAPQDEPRNTTHADWMGIDLPLVQISDGLLRLPGQSKGADAEVLHAQRCDVPVFFSIDAVKAHFWLR